MAKRDLVEEIELPEGVKLEVDGKRFRFSGQKGDVERLFDNPRAKIQVSGNKMIIEAKDASKRDKAIIKTYKAHILNAVHGCIEPFSYKLKICSGHFPMNVSVNNNKLIIKNFLGEKVPREVNLRMDVEVKVDGELIHVSSPDKEKAGQVAAKIEQATRRPGFDKRIFQDGIYAVEKAGKEV